MKTQIPKTEPRFVPVGYFVQDRLNGNRRVAEFVTYLQAEEEANRLNKENGWPEYKGYTQTITVHSNKKTLYSPKKYITK